MAKVLLEETRSLNQVTPHSRSVILPPHMLSMAHISEDAGEVRVQLVEDDDHKIGIKISPKLDN